MTYEEAVCAEGALLWDDIVRAGLIQGDTSSVTANRSLVEREVEAAREQGLDVTPSDAASFVAGCLCDGEIEGFSWDTFDAAFGRAIELLLRIEGEPELADDVWRARP